jgi:hypothetical protein
MKVGGQLHSLAALLTRERAQIFIAQYAGWDLTLVWTLWRKDKSLAPLGIKSRFPCLPAHSLGSVSTELFTASMRQDCYFLSIMHPVLYSETVYRYVLKS